MLQELDDNDKSVGTSEKLDLRTVDLPLKGNLFARQRAMDNVGLQEFKICTLQLSTRPKNKAPAVAKLGHSLGEDSWKKYLENTRCLRMIPVQLGSESSWFCIWVDA